MKRLMIFLMLIVVAAAQPAAAQVFTTPKGGAENVTFEQVGGGTVHIIYDLVSSDPRAVFQVTLEASQDRGATFTVRPMSVSGDVGAGVKPGTGKRIVWESGRDVERLEIDQFRFRISAQAGPLEMQKADPPPAPVAAAPTPAAPPKTETPPAAPVNQPQTAAAKPKSGGGAKWLLIGGGAAAAAGVAAASGGSGGGSTATSNSPGNTPATANRAPVISARSHDFQLPSAVALVLVTDITFEVFATDDDGNAMTATWAFGDNTTATAPVSGGRAVTQKTYASGGLFRPSVTVSDGRGGSATSEYQQLTANTVTGLYVGTVVPGGMTVRLNLVQNGTAVAGDYVDGQGRSATVSTQLRAPRTMEMTLAYRGGGSDIYTVVFAADLKALTAPSRAGTTLTLARTLP